MSQKRGEVSMSLPTEPTMLPPICVGDIVDWFVLDLGGAVVGDREVSLQPGAGVVVAEGFDCEVVGATIDGSVMRWTGERFGSTYSA